MMIAIKKLYYFARRPVCREFGMMRALATGVCLAAITAWGVPVLATGARVMQLSSVHLAVAAQLHQARQHAKALGARIRFCRSDDGLTCADSGGWEQGWIAFEDVNGDGVRARTERVLHVGGALPGAFVLSGDLNGRGVKLCLRDGQEPACRPDQLSLALLSDGSRPRPS